MIVWMIKYKKSLLPYVCGQTKQGVIRLLISDLDESGYEKHTWKELGKYGYTCVKVRVEELCANKKS